MKIARLLVLVGIITNTCSLWADDNVNYSFVETFDTLAGNNGAALSSQSVFDNSGWTVSGNVYKGVSNNEVYVKLAKSGGGGSLTTPTLTNIPTYSLLTFKVKGYNDNERQLSISGTNCIVSPQSLSNIPTDEWYECTVYVAKTDDYPKITFTAASGKRVYIDDVSIVYGGTSLPITISSAKYAPYSTNLDNFNFCITPNSIRLNLTL